LAATPSEDMSTPSITAPALPGSTARLSRAGARERLRRLARGNEADPAWSRPLLWLVALLAGALMLWGLTRNGYANSYYAEAAQAASRSWTAWLTNALDVSGSDSLDKGPLSNMLMGLSGRLFGFSSFSMLLPEALCGIASVLLLHNIVRRTLGHRAAILAALMLALTPIFVAMSRFNNPDALLVLTEIAAAWALVRALESGRTRHVLLCGMFVGLAFNVKMLQAYLIVPGLALTFLLAGKGAVRRRLSQTAAGAGAMLAVSFAWYGTMMLLPAADRPWVGDTTDNSWFTLLFGANGLSRVAGTSSGPGAAASFGGQPGILRLFNSTIGGQIAWLLPLALAGLALGLWSRRRAVRTDRRRSAYVLWGGWAVVSWAVFSFSKGTFHPYYTTALAPAVAVLSAGGLVLLWERSRRSAVWAAALSAAVIATAILSASLLGRTAGFVPWLAPLALTLALVAASAIMLPHIRRARARTGSRTIASVAALAALVAILAGPASYSIATVGKSLAGSNPLAGPASAAAAGPGGGGPGAAPRPSGLAVGTRGPGRGGQPGFQAGSGRSGGAPGAIGNRGGAMNFSVSRATVSYLEAHQGSARYLAAAVGSTTAGSLALQSARNVINMGGFNGSDPTPTLSQLERLVSKGELHYVLLNSAGNGAGRGGFSTSATRERDSWIETHGTVVKIAGQRNTTMTLYYIPSVA
jgi:4-amino-4-deoxy-L-arabinose transferase-like glycosyltransferase